MNVFKKTIITTLVLISVFNSAYAQNYSVIINKKVKINSITYEDLRDIYLGKRIYWDEKRVRIKAAILIDESAVTESFLKDVLYKNITQFNKLWRRKLFSGSGVPPRRFKIEDELIDYISKTDGAIGVLGVRRPAKKNTKYITVK